MGKWRVLGDGDLPNILQVAGSAVLSLEYWTILLAIEAGFFSAPWWLTIPAASGALLFVSDRGQCRELIEQVASLDAHHILTLSVPASLANNLCFCALAYLLGVMTRWI